MGGLAWGGAVGDAPVKLSAKFGDIFPPADPCPSVCADIGLPFGAELMWKVLLK